MKDRSDRIQSIIKQAGNIPAERKAELLELVAGLQSEIDALSQTHRDEAFSITHFADASAHEAVRTEKNPQLAETALQGLRASVQGFEETHPDLVGIVSRFATALSNMGL